MIKIRQNVLFFITALLFSGVYAQNQNGNYLTWFDTTVGIQNTPIFEVLGYVEQFRSINEKHKFFTSEDFVTGSITYDGQEYYRLNLKYNLSVEEVIVNLKDGFETGSLQPEKSKISEFTVHGSNFENIGTPTASASEISGFLKFNFLPLSFAFIFVTNYYGSRISLSTKKRLLFVSILTM